MARDIVGILLAAGHGRRFGGDKLHHPLADGTPMALAAARNLRLACATCVTVLRPEQQALADLLRTAGIQVHFADATRLGMGHSLACAVGQQSDAAGWLVALADMPFIRPASYGAVVHALRAGASLAAPQYQGQRGHPVGFAAAWLPQLRALHGDQGARDILRHHPQDLQLLACDDPGVLADIDTRAALEKQSRSHQP